MVGRRRTPRWWRAGRAHGAPRPGGRAAGSSSRPSAATTVRGRQPQVPAPQVLEQRPLVGGQHRQLQVGVRPRLAAQQQVQRPAARHPPGTPVAGHHLECPASGLVQGGHAVDGQAAGLLVRVEAPVGPRPVGRRLEHGIQVHRAVHARDRLTVGLGLLDVDLGLEPVGVDQQQHQVGAAGEPVILHGGVLCCRGAADDAVAMERLGGVGPVLAARSQSRAVAMWKRTLIGAGQRRSTPYLLARCKLSDR